MRSIKIGAALLIWMSSPPSACEIAIRDIKGATEKLTRVFDLNDASCASHDTEIKCSAKDKILWLNAIVMPDDIPGAFSAIIVSASDKEHKEKIKSAFVDHLVDRSPDGAVKSRMIRAMESGEEFNFVKDACFAIVSTKGAALSISLAGPMVR